MIAGMDYKALKELLQPIAEEASRNIRSGHLSAIAEAHWAGVQRVMYPLLSFIAEYERKGEGDMDKLASSLKVEMVKFSELPSRRRESMWQPIVKEFCEAYENLYFKWERNPNRKMEDMPHLKVPTDQINISHFLNVLRRLKALKEIDESLAVTVKNKEPYLMKKPSKVISGK